MNVKDGEFGVSEVFIPLAVAFAGIVVIYTFLDHTICHFNPAITLAAIVTRKLPVVLGIIYIIAQFVGFILACCVVTVNFSKGWIETMNMLAPSKVNLDLSNTGLFFTEFTLSAIIVFVAFENGINSKRNPEFSLYGDQPQPDRSIITPLTIGLTLGLLALLASTTSGGAFNPAFVFAPQLLGNVWSAGWEYYVGDFVGGIVGALIQVWLLYK